MVTVRLVGCGLGVLAGSGVGVVSAARVASGGWGGSSAGRSGVPGIRIEPVISLKIWAVWTRRSSPASRTMITPARHSVPAVNAIIKNVPKETCRLLFRLFAMTLPPSASSLTRCLHPFNGAPRNILQKKFGCSFPCAFSRSKISLRVK